MNLSEKHVREFISFAYNEFGLEIENENLTRQQIVSSRRQKRKRGRPPKNPTLQSKLEKGDVYWPVPRSEQNPDACRLDLLPKGLSTRLIVPPEWYPCDFCADARYNALCPNTSRCICYAYWVARKLGRLADKTAGELFKK